MSQNICNDFIIQKYFIDLQDYIKSKFKPDELRSKEVINPIKLKELLHNLKKIDHQLESHYFNSIIKEFNLINFSDDKFERNADSISILIDLLIPFLLFKGYSPSSLNEILSKFKGGYRPTVNRFFEYFNFKARTFEFLIDLGEDKKAAEEFTYLLQGTLDIFCKKVKVDDLPKGFLTKSPIPENNMVIGFTSSSIDPHSFIRSSYDLLLKNYVIQRNRPSLNVFNNYFDRCFWKLHTKGHILPIKLEFDPINVFARKSTFRNTVLACNNQFKVEDDIIIPKNPTLAKSLYYYNLAVGSKSIENSLSLLWTALECILPYRVTHSDIECIQHFVSKSLSFGSLSRDINSFGQRFIESNRWNENKLGEFVTINGRDLVTSDGLVKWFEWIKDDKECKFRLEKLKSCSELLAYQYTKMGKNLSVGKLEDLYLRIKSSEESIKFQLQRIYLHRNQIVHSGDLVNEYTNLWLHLEWYVGKIIAFGYQKQEIDGDQKELEDIYRDLESDFDYLMSYLQKNKTLKIKDSKRVQELIFQHPWQAF